MEIKMDNSEIYYGDRGEKFKNYIRSILIRGNIKPKFIEAVLNEDSMRILDAAFTHESANPKQNYQFLENLGDVTANETLVWYFSRRFPQINCPAGTDTIARLKIKYGAKKSFSQFANKLGMWPYISASEYVRETQRSARLEDVFEAFIGAIKKILDATFMIGVGNSVVYDIISGFMDKLDIPLDYYDLFDAKSRLNETIMWYRKENKDKPWYYLSWVDPKKRKNIENFLFYREEKGSDKIFTSYAIVQNLGFSNRPLVIGEGKDYIKVEAEIKAAEQALTWLSRHGIKRPIPEFYTTYCNFDAGEFMI
jgi:dsRNA-specific ribonuclease